MKFNKLCESLVRTKPYKKYKIKNYETGEIFEFEGRHKIQEFTNISKSSVGKIINGIKVKNCPYIGL